MTTPQQITPADIARWEDRQTLELGNGLRAVIEVKHDEDHGPPWEEEDGHGPVSEWRRAYGDTYPKKPGERLLIEDDRGRAARFYDFQAAMRIAKRDGWGLSDEAKEALAKKHGKPVESLTRGEICAAAVERDFQHLRDWCRDEWHWIGVCVRLEDADGNEVESDSLWGIESCGDYWREVAAEIVNTLLASHEVEQTERAEWEARDVVTEGAR